MNSIRQNYIVKSQKIIGKKEYWQIYNNIKDSILEWQNCTIGLYKYYNSSNLKVDTVICINNAGNKLRTCTIRKCINNCLQDEIVYLNGVKIKGNWYFFDAASLALIRKYYQRDIHKSLSWKMMEHIATSQLYSNYLKPNGEINDAFFNELTSGAWGKAESAEEWDSIYIDIVRRNWSEN